MAPKRRQRSVLSTFLAALLTAGILTCVHGIPREDQEALLSFYRNVSSLNGCHLNWHRSSSACDTWTGVTCDGNGGRVVALRLPRCGLRGAIPSDTISRMSSLRVLSLSNNNLSGSIPSDFSKLGNLTALHLQFNSFSGRLPNFSCWRKMVVLDLSFNRFNGSIPLSLTSMTQLTALNLSNNLLSGSIPDVNLPSLKELSLINNTLLGNLPISLQRFPLSCFIGNQISGGNPRKKGSFTSAMLGVAVGALAVGIIVAVVCINSCKHEGKKRDPTSEKVEKKGAKIVDKIVFFEGSSLAFDLEDLLRASAEVLGKGGLGISYKAALEDMTTVAIKRLKEATIPRREYEQVMEVLGNISHENVTPLRAYYYSKEEKLILYDYYDQGSVSSLLHSKKGKGSSFMGWETRLRIASGTAKGVAHIHKQSNGTLVHGNIRSSNIFLNRRGYGCVSEGGLMLLVNQAALPKGRATGYRAPEFADIRRATQASDVYSFGVFLLELLTGKSPVNSTCGDEVLHLVRWVHAVVREEWTSEVFDVELLRYPNIEEKMVEMLQIAMSCVVKVPQNRPTMAEVEKMLEEISAPPSETDCSG